MSAIDDLFALKLQQGDKFTPDEVDNDLRVLAEFWLTCYEGDFEFLTDLKRTMRERPLSNGMLKGVLNCMLAQMREPLEPGMYKRDDAIYKVQLSRTSKRPYAKQVKLWEACENHVAPDDRERYWMPCPNCGRDDGAAGVSFDYAPEAIKRLALIHRMSLDEAKALGCLYGTCIVCGRTLSDEKSIAAGIGPVCAKRV